MTSGRILLRSGLVAAAALMLGLPAGVVQAQAPWPPPTNAQMGQFPSSASAAPAPSMGQFPPENGSAPHATAATPFGAAPAVGSFSTGPAPSAGFGPPQQSAGQDCAEKFVPMRDDAQKKGNAIKAAADRKAPPQEICKAFKVFTAAEAKVVKFVKDNAARCGIPAEAVKTMQTNHSKSLQISRNVCNASAGGGGAPAAPSLSDALGTSRIPSSSNIRTGKGGTFDTLSGNAIQR